jgi:hypothetical protein
LHISEKSSNFAARNIKQVFKSYITYAF